jgi:YhcH/YjgK/YiaL family protein
MLIDTIDNIAQYNYLPKNIAKALHFLQNTDFTNIADGKYSISLANRISGLAQSEKPKCKKHIVDENTFYIVQRYRTQIFAAGKLEAHRKYLDIQYIVSGEEILGYAPNHNLDVITPYDETKDISFYAKPPALSTIRLTRKMFCILYPNAAHMPGKYLLEPCDVLKVVIKIKIPRGKPRGIYPVIISPARS